MVKLIFKRLKKTLFVVSLLCISTSAFAEHDQSAVCGQGHEGWKQDCTNTNDGAPSPQIGSKINGLLLGFLIIGLYYKRTYPRSRKDNVN